jgi:opacity protein-like surface antigen
MRKLILVFAGLFLASGISYGQNVSLQIGRNWSVLDDGKGKQPIDPLKEFKEPFTGYSIFIGVDYLNRKNYNLSSNLGYITKKGEHSFQSLRPNGGSDLITYKTDLGYLSLNTTVDLKYPVRDLLIPYVCFGPRLDYLISDKSESRWKILKPYVFGMTLGGGIKYNLSKMQIGLRFDQYLNFNKNSELGLVTSYTGFESAVPIIEKTSLLSISISYKLK